MTPGTRGGPGPVHRAASPWGPRGDLPAARHGPPAAGRPGRP
ncbi:hypothetical protein KCH_60120 [Kitasatospora cheerisanensis KCTC 2395]|uniref:Uncharacterized protein n=1 Tax=Kitasatospora cheerisanensis KCTC 2395 TaxID=1348663 RepID=A0A066YL66_9ACTN|nr:hypothetical protein KCH_60120 [Kitasatospora cheerisanensis KCTC 2395]